METEDFSFPRISDTCAYSIDSPPLWNLSSTGSSDPKKGDEKDCFEAKKVSSKGQRKSFSCVQIGKKITEGEDEEVSMDLLWEVLNEELSSTKGFATSSSRELVEFRCATTLTVAKTKGALLQSKNRTSMVAMVKVLKKLFSPNGKPRKRIF
ncbi:hypothetical protein SESBI_11293 [Sesbania bispinosa]|nr:hypothetical protein SESBI_11293 [Sesbania bispinosa]